MSKYFFFVVVNLKRGKCGDDTCRGKKEREGKIVKDTGREWTEEERET